MTAALRQYLLRSVRFYLDCNTTPFRVPCARHRLLRLCENLSQALDCNTTQFRVPCARHMLLRLCENLSQAPERSRKPELFLLKKQPPQMHGSPLPSPHVLWAAATPSSTSPKGRKCCIIAGNPGMTSSIEDLPRAFRPPPPPTHTELREGTMKFNDGARPEPLPLIEVLPPLAQRSSSPHAAADASSSLSTH